MARISLDTFINKSVGKQLGVPWNPRLDGECVSMVQRYFNECFGEPLKIRGHAVDLGNTLIKDRVGKRVTTPRYGDIIVWGSNMGGGYGHVAIYLNQNAIFDQNNSSVKPTRTSQVRPMIKIKPIQYIRMNTALVEDKPKYQEEVYAFTANTVINVRSNYNTNAKIVGTLKKAETFNYIGKIEFDGYVWITDGAEWLAVREVKNGIRGKLWGTLQAQKDTPKPVQPKPPVKTKEYLQLDKRVTWNVYKLGTPLRGHLKIATLNPKKFGGLEYEILDRPFTNAITIQTRDYGKVNIYIGADVKHLYKIVRK